MELFTPGAERDGRPIDLFANRQTLVRSVLVCSAVFAAIHLGSGAGLPGLLHIFISGLFLSVLYLYRGFGIAVAAHALFDIFLGFGII